MKSHWKNSHQTQLDSYRIVAKFFLGYIRKIYKREFFRTFTYNSGNIRIDMKNSLAFKPTSTHFITKRSAETFFGSFNIHTDKCPYVELWNERQLLISIDMNDPNIDENKILTILSEDLLCRLSIPENRYDFIINLINTTRKLKCLKKT